MPSEAGAIGAFGAFIIALLRKKITWDNFSRALLTTGRTAVFILVIYIGATVMQYLLVISGLTDSLRHMVLNLPLSPMLILAVILITYIPLGMFIETASMMFITLPIYFPIVIELGFDPIHFGVLTTILAELGMITPPIGLNCFVIKGVAQDISFSTIFKGIIPFAVTMLVAIAFLVAFPKISLFLPGMMR